MSIADLAGCVFFFQAEDGIRDLVRSRGLGDVYKRQVRSVWKVRMAFSRARVIFSHRVVELSVLSSILRAVSYTHLTLPTIYSV